MYEDELIDLDDQNFLDEQPKQKQKFQPVSKNRSKKPSNQDDNELEFFDEDIDDQDDYMKQKQPVALPKITNKQEINYKQNEPPQKTVQKDDRLNQINQKDADNFWEEEQNNEFNYEYEEDESHITKTERIQPVQKAGKQQDFEEEDYDRTQQEHDQDQQEEYFDYEYESDNNNKQESAANFKQNAQTKEKKVTQEEDNYEDEYDEYFEENNGEEQQDQDENQEEEEENYDDYQQQDQTYDQNISQNDYSVQKTRISHQSKVRRPPVHKPEKKPTYAEKYAKIIEDKDYTNWNDKQLIQENNVLRSMLKQLSSEITTLIEKAKPQKQTKKGVSLENKVKILREELKNNQKKLEQQQAEIKKIRLRINQVSSPKYLNELNEEIKKNQKLIEDKKKKNKIDQLEQNKKAKNLDKIENLVGNPDILVEKQKKAKELDDLERKNIALQEQINKLRADIEENQKKLPKVSQLLQEKIDQAVKLKVDVDPDQPLTKLREKYSELDRKKQRLVEHLELLRSKEGKAQVTEREIIELKKQIKQKDNDINMVEMQIMEQRKQVDEVKNKIPDRYFNDLIQNITAYTQQNYNQNDQSKQDDEDLQKNLRKLTSAKPVLQTKPPIMVKTDKKKQDSSPQQANKAEKKNNQNSSPQQERKQTQYIAEGPIVEQFAEESTTQIENIEDKSNVPDIKPTPSIQNQSQPAKPLNKPFSFKKNVKSSETETKQKENENALTFGKQNQNEFLIGKSDDRQNPNQQIQILAKKEEHKNQDALQENKVQLTNKSDQVGFVLHKDNGEDNKKINSDENKKTASFLNDQVETNKKDPQSNDYQLTLGSPQDEINKETSKSHPKIQMRMMKKPDNMGQNYSNVSNDIVSNQQNNSEQFSIASNPQPEENNSFQVKQQTFFKPKFISSRRNRILKQNDSDNLAGGYDFSKKFEPQRAQIEDETLKNKKEQLQDPQKIEYNFGGNDGGSRRNRNLNNPSQKSILNEDQTSFSLKESTPIQDQTKEFTLNRNPQTNNQENNKPQNSFNLNQKQQENQKEASSFNLNKKQEEPSYQLTQKQDNKPPKRQRDGPKKLDLWGDDDTGNTDFNNIKSLDQEPPKTQVQPKIQIEEKLYNKEPDLDREMTLDEILGGNIRKEEKKNPIVELQADNNFGDAKKRNRIGIQQVNQAEKQRQLASKAENQDFFGDLDI